MVNTVSEFFAALEHAIDPTKTLGIDATFQFVITGEGGGEWYVRLVDGKPSVAQGTADHPDIILAATASDWLDMVNGKLSGQTAFLTGKLKLQGDITLAMKLQSLLG